MPYDVSPLPFPAFSSRILAVYSSGKHARKTFLRLRQVLRELGELGVISTDQLTTDMLARWITKRARDNANTVNGLLSTASAITTYAFDEGWLARKPVYRRLRRRASDCLRNAPSGYGDIAGLLDHLRGRGASWEGRRLASLAWLIALTGVRLGEAVHAHTSDFDLERKTLAIVPRPRLKTEASRREVPLPDALVEVLEPWLAACDTRWAFPGIRRKGPWTGGAGGQRSLDRLQAEARAIGIDHITWHSLRHAYGTYALERWEVPLWIVQKVLGHTDVRTTQRYLHLDRSPAIARAARPLSYRV